MRRFLSWIWLGRRIHHAFASPMPKSELPERPVRKVPALLVDPFIQ
jgi:hypothetical protein